MTGRRELLRGVLGLTAGGLATGLLAGCRTNPSASEDVGFASGDGSYQLVAGAKRVTAPVLTGPDLDGKSLTTAGRSGKVIVLNVWGSWCSPCRAEAPELVEAARQTRDVAQFLGINTRDAGTAPAQAFVRAFKVPYPNFYDPDGDLLMQLGALPAKAIPSTVFIDRQGRIAARILGQATTATFVGAVHDVAAGS